MLNYKQNKFTKIRKGKIFGVEKKVNFLFIGNFGIKSIFSGRIKDCQIESARKLLTKNIKKTDKIWFRLFTFLAVTSKPIETRMGKGKGNIDFYCFPLKAGRILFEFQGVSLQTALKLNSGINSKLPVKTKLIQFYD